MENVLLVRYGEIHLKGLNRPFFERKLVEGIKHALSDLGATVRMEQGRIFVLGIKDKDRDEAVDRLTRVFGIHSISPAVAVEKEWGAIADSAMELMRRALGESRSATFKVMARRADKRFPMNSEEINRELGHVLLESFPGLSVDVHSPKIKMCVEIREKAYLYCEEIPGANGMPTGTAGRAALLISGGIDSPVAGYLMAKRGLELSAVHFYSYPYTSERARDKVVDLTGLRSHKAASGAVYRDTACHLRAVPSQGDHGAHAQAYDEDSGALGKGRRRAGTYHGRGPWSGSKPDPGEPLRNGRCGGYAGIPSSYRV